MYSEITNGEIEWKLVKRYENEEKELNGLLEREDWKNTKAFINWAENNERNIIIYYNNKKKSKIKELIEKWEIDEDVFVRYIITK